MKITLTEACGIVHEAEAELVGVEQDGYLLYVVRFDVDSTTLQDAEVNVDLLPAKASVVIEASYGGGIVPP